MFYFFFYLKKESYMDANLYYLYLATQKESPNPHIFPDTGPANIYLIPIIQIKQYRS